MLTVILLAGCGKKDRAGASKPLEQVGFVTPVQGAVSQYEELPGRVEPVDDVEIKARVTGYVEKVNFKEGTEVRTGDLLYTIDPREYQAKVAAAAAEVERSRAAQAQAKSDYARAQNLAKNTVIAEQEVEAQRTKVLEADASLHLAEAELAQARLNLEYTQIRSPIDGKISRTDITEGNLVEAGDALTSVVRQAPVYVLFDVPERAVLRWDKTIKKLGGDRLRDNVKAAVGLLNEEGFPREATVDFVDNAVDSGTGTLRARAILENADRVARVGLYARVRLSLKMTEPALLVPERAVGVDQGQRFVFVVGAGNRIEYRKVTPGQMHDGMLAISDGLKEGDRVVVEGLLALRPGMQVEPREVPRT